MKAYCKQNHHQIGGMIFVSDWLTSDKIYDVEVSVEEKTRRDINGNLYEEDEYHYEFIDDQGRKRNYRKQEFDRHFVELNEMRISKIDKII